MFSFLRPAAKSRSVRSLAPAAAATAAFLLFSGSGKAADRPSEKKPAASNVSGQEPPKKTLGLAGAANGPKTKRHLVGDVADLEAFFDGILSVQLEGKHVAGAVVSVVADGKVLFSKGYGYADVATRRRVDPETTQFRIASVSKLFTWTAVMQLAEQGKVDLEADVNVYLKGVQVPPAYGKPVTLKNLLTHSPGFEDVVIGLFARRPEEMKSLTEVLRTQMPARVRPPGTLSSYSNHGTALAGAVVADVVGKPWEDAIEQMLLQPLKLKHTLVRQPEREKLPATLAKGYRWKDGWFKEEPFEYCPAAPAGAISTSAADISRFMIAHLNDGQIDGTRILKPETARRMRERLFAHDPKVDAMCYGFWELHRNGQRILHHGGDTIFFHTLFAMLPEHHVGLFVSYNTDRGATGRDELFDAFLDRYYPVPEEPRLKGEPESAATHKDYEGEYGATRRSHSTYAKLAGLVQNLMVKSNADGTVSLVSSRDSRRYVEVEPRVFQQIDGKDRVVFHEDGRGSADEIFVSAVPAIALVRNQWYERSGFHWSLLGAGCAIFLSALCVWPAIAFSTRGLPRVGIRTRGSAFFSIIAWLLSAACLALVLGIIGGLQDPEEIAFGTPPGLRWVLMMPIAIAFLSLTTLLGAALSWRKGYWRLTGRLHYTLVTLAGLLFCWFAWYWRILPA